MKTAWTEKCFNSTLVQLKADYGNLCRDKLHRFQFYLSSIKSLTKKLNTLNRVLFQFYLSSIKSRIQTMGYLPRFLFQFYLSSIKSQKLSNRMAERLAFQFYLSSIKRSNSLCF